MISTFWFTERGCESTAMENFESINAIVDEFKYKKGTLAIFGLDSLYEQGKSFQFGVPEPSVPNPDPPSIVYEDEDPSFCSIFSDPDSLVQTTQATQLTQLTSQVPRSIAKLLSDLEILSSEFDLDHSQPILLSEKG